MADDDDDRDRRFDRRMAHARDAALFLVGLGGFLVVLLSPELRDPSILVLLAGMMGLPAFLRAKDDDRG